MLGQRNGVAKELIGKEKRNMVCVNGLMVRILPFQGRGPGSIPG